MDIIHQWKEGLVPKTALFWRIERRERETMNFQIPNGLGTPDIVKIKQMEKQLEESRYEELENLLKKIQETTKEQIEYAKSEAESAKKDAKKANRIAVISSITGILSLFVGIGALIVSLIVGGLI